MNVYKVHDWAGRFEGIPLAIVAPGPSFDLVPPELFGLCPVMALNHAITAVYGQKRHWWVSNDHDRTFNNTSLCQRLLTDLAGYAPWRTITNRKFIPGKFGDVDWIDHRGNPKKPMKWRLPLPKGSTVWWYHENERHDGHLYHGHSVLELALEVGTLWGFDPIVLLGVDLELLGTPKKPIYYARPWQWKDIPRKILKSHKLSDMILSLRAQRERWPGNIYHTSPYAKNLPFVKASLTEAAELLSYEGMYPPPPGP